MSCLSPATTRSGLFLAIVRGAALALVVFAAGCSDEQVAGDATTITGEELQARLKTADAPLVLDVRTSGEYASGHIPGAIHIPHTQISRRLSEMERFRDAEVVVYCTRGPRAYGAESVLRDAGFKKVRHLQGDITRWRRDGRPVVR